MKLFSTLAGLILLAVAAAHAYRIYAGLTVVIGGHDVPMMASYVGAVVSALVGAMTLAESRG